jgi:hypothetical protein
VPITALGSWEKPSPTAIAHILPNIV